MLCEFENLTVISVQTTFATTIGSVYLLAIQTKHTQIPSETTLDIWNLISCNIPTGYIKQQSHMQDIVNLPRHWFPKLLEQSVPEKKKKKSKHLGSQTLLILLTQHFSLH